MQILYRVQIVQSTKSHVSTCMLDCSVVLLSSKSCSGYCDSDPSALLPLLPQTSWKCFANWRWRSMNESCLVISTRQWLSQHSSCYEYWAVVFVLCSLLVCGCKTCIVFFIESRQCNVDRIMTWRVLCMQSSSSLESNLEGLAAVLDADLPNYKSKILNILMEW